MHTRSHIYMRRNAYAWLMVFGSIAAFGASWGIGANDVANSFATSKLLRCVCVCLNCRKEILFCALIAPYKLSELLHTHMSALLFSCNCMPFAASTLIQSSVSRDYTYVRIRSLLIMIPACRCWRQVNYHVPSCHSKSVQEISNFLSRNARMQAASLL